MATMAELQPIFEQAEREDRFWSEQWARFLDEYPERFVAVRDGAVVAATLTLDDMDRALTQAGLGVKDVSLRWVSAKLACLVL